jgi:monofunctional biosynthetic peptidoglycan transglycosylase
MREAMRRIKGRKKYTRVEGRHNHHRAVGEEPLPHAAKIRVPKNLEIGIAFEMELLLPKKRILELYLESHRMGSGRLRGGGGGSALFPGAGGEARGGAGVLLAAVIPNPKRWGRWPPGPYVKKRMGDL